jgi:asparagine synthase (glutamine-hydrolysing)
VEQSQLTVRSPFLDNDLVGLAFQAPATMRTDSDLSYQLVKDGNPALVRIPTDRGVAYSSATILNKLRWAKEEFLARVEYAYDYGMPQWLARVDHLFAQLKLERLFLGRQKFCHFRVLYRDGLASYVKEVLLDPRSLSRPYLKRRQVEQMVTDHLRGNRNFTTEIHRLLTVELVHRLLIEQR